MKTIIFSLLATLTVFSTVTAETITLTESNPRIWQSTRDGKPDQFGVSQYRIPHLFVKPNGDIVACCVGRLSKPSDHGISACFFALSKDQGKTWKKFNAPYVNWKENKPPKGVLPLTKITNEVNVVWSQIEKKYICIYMHELRVYVSKSPDLEKWSDPQKLDIAKLADGSTANLWQCPTSMLIDQKTGEVGFAICGINNKRWVVRLIWTKDFKTFEESPNIPKGSCNETNFVKIKDGRYFVSSRAGKKRINWYYDRVNKKWSIPHPVTVPHRGSCQADVIYDSNGHLFLSMPSNPGSRLNGCIYRSKDQGKTWENIKLLNEGYFGYSSLVILNDGSKAILSEQERCDGPSKGTSLHFKNLGKLQGK
ncbi:exo-alpha-sialidase [Verrucomicrobiaceae bacterium N1E253]|uniref:exo-alpha-sialidase n=1 Tax=Oceaniferula marina TaxID=2748318 RepID=A0A851GLJ8_9BACT|nr:sialidase family protein [Oceaniferula marina]NWK55640.1 exo-alpha-sialidase [Oceaniferula marina]